MLTDLNQLPGAPIGAARESLSDGEIVSIIEWRVVHMDVWTGFVAPSEVPGVVADA